MPRFQDPDDPVIAKDGIVLYDRFGFDHIPMDRRFAQVRRSAAPLAAGLVVGGAYTSKEPLSSSKYAAFGSNALCLKEEWNQVGELNPRLVSQFAPWDTLTPRHRFFILTSAYEDGGRKLVFVDSFGSDSVVLTEAAALALFQIVPNIIPGSKMQDIQTRVTNDVTMVKKIRSLQYREGHVVSFRALHPRCKTVFYESFNQYLGGIDSPYHVPEDRPIRDIPASAAERTDVPAPESEPATPDLPMTDEEDPITLPPCTADQAIADAYAARVLESVQRAQAVRSAQSAASRNPIRRFFVPNPPSYDQQYQNYMAQVSSASAGTSSTTPTSL